jgi:hypothetical protein
MYALDLKTPGGRAVYELIKLAYVEKRPLEARSLGTCSVHWKSEGVKNVVLK